MIRGKFLLSTDDTDKVMEIRRKVFCDEMGFSPESEIDKYDQMAIYALVYDENDVPGGTGRLYINDEGRFCVGRVCVLKEMRGKYLGDLVMRMLLFRALELNAPEVYITSQLDKVSFFERYGLAPYSDIRFDEGYPHRMMRADAAHIRIEGSCKHCEE
jgi:predicted GNAT family N-acyltransferase